MDQHSKRYLVPCKNMQDNTPLGMTLCETVLLDIKGGPTRNENCGFGNVSPICFHERTARRFASSQLSRKSFWKRVRGVLRCNILGCCTVYYLRGDDTGERCRVLGLLPLVVLKPTRESDHYSRRYRIKRARNTHRSRPFF